VNKYLEGYIYHMTHKDNLENILSRRAILSKNRVIHEYNDHRSIALNEVQSLRDRIYILDKEEGRYRQMHDYVPFYFITRTPMLYVQKSRGIQDDIVYLEVDRKILYQRGVIFTDGNASNQQLTASGLEKVNIIPSSNLIEECERTYYPSGPCGTNINRSNFYSDVECLQLIDWQVLDRTWWEGDEERRKRHAEVLVPDILPLGRVISIIARNQALVQHLNMLINKHGLAGRIPYATLKSSLYFY
jgi:ssDNA thymidine ADP-ribosyltransferase, DarT